jgi:3',5'-cyclic AMP phosphodiesterase CpdA
MSILKWIHISDIHITSSGEHLAKFNSKVVLDALWRDIDDRERIDPNLAELDFAFITGDLAWSGADEGSEDEYDEVYKRIILPLSKHARVPIGNIFIVPGNHDISRSKRTPDVESKERELRV